MTPPTTHTKIKEGKLESSEHSSFSFIHMGGEDIIYNIMEYTVT